MLIEVPMIARHWRGWTKPQHADAYEALLKDKVLQELKANPGYVGAQTEVVADILLDETMAVVAANHRIGKIDILDDGLQFAFVLLGHLTAKDHRDLVRLTDGPVGV
jgi:hypothetical protein